MEPSSSLTLKSSIHQLEQASADADQAGYGQLWTKNATPNELYFTNDAGNDIQITSGSSMAGGGGTSHWIQQYNMRWYTRYLNWYLPNTTYGLGYYQWSSTTGTTTLPTTWADVYNPYIVIPKDCVLKSYNLTGAYQSAQTIELALLNGTYDASFGSAGEWDLTQVGTTQSLVVGTAHVQNTIGQTGLSVNLSAGQNLIPFLRRSTYDTSNYFYFKGSFSIVCEVS